MSNKKGVMKRIEKEDTICALLVADDFNNIFSPFLSKTCSPLLPVASIRSVEYSLECLSRSGVHEVILFCPFQSEALQQFFRESKWSSEKCLIKVTLVVSENCFSLGDVMRDLDNKALLKCDFILMSTFTVSNIPLLDMLNQHKLNVKQDRGAAMTMIMQDVGDGNQKDETVVAIDSLSKKVLFYSPMGLLKKVSLPMEVIAEHSSIQLGTNLIDTGICICSPSVPVLFSDNFDFQSKEDFIYGVLQNEDALASRIYCCMSNNYGRTIRDWLSYQKITSDIIHRWSYPLVPDILPDAKQALTHLSGFSYKHSSVNVDLNCIIEESILSKNTKIGKNASIIRSYIGENCRIGCNVRLIDSIVLDNVVVEDCSVILSVLGQNVQLGPKNSLKNCQVFAESIIPGNSCNLEGKLISPNPFSNESVSSERLGENAFFITTNVALDGNGDVDEEDLPLKGRFLCDPLALDLDDADADVSSVSNSEDSESASQEVDDCGVFYAEVLDSLQRGYEERLPCSNLILEINSSRYAYNISLEEVTLYTSKALFALPARLKCSAKLLLTYFKPLILNYIKSKEAQRECLAAFTEMYEELGNEVNTCLHYLYDADILPEEVIESWFSELSGTDALRTKVAPFIKWLREADETSESDEDG